MSERKNAARKMKPWTGWANASVSDGESGTLRVYDSAEEAADDCHRGERVVRVEIREAAP